MALQYAYYDTPEGQDIWLKSLALSKYAACTGLIYSVYDVLLYSHPQGPVATLGRITYLTAPLIGMAAAFVATTNISQNLRGKNDKTNYFLGGVASGAVFGGWRGSVLKGFAAAMLLGAVGFSQKLSLEEGWEFFPECKMQTNSAWSARNDYTLHKDYPKGFTTGECTQN